MANNLGEAVLKITADVRGLISGLSKGSKAVKQFGTSVTQVGQTLTRIGVQAAAAGAAISAAFAPIIAQGAQFERSMSFVQAVTQATADDFAKLSDEAQRLGETTRFTATQAAEAIRFLGQAGFETDEILNSVADTLNLASIGQLELSRAAEITANTLRVFGLEAQDTGRVVDVLTQTAFSSNTNIELLASSLQFAAPVAAGFGLSLEEVNTALGVLANQGIKGTIAGTALSQAIVATSKESDKATEILAKYGLTTADVSSETNDLRTVITRLGEAGVTASDLIGAFGIRGGRALLALKQAGIESFDELNAKIDDSRGAASEAAITVEDNLIGAFTILKSTIESLNIEIFNVIEERARGVVESVTEVVRTVRQWVEENQELVGTITKIAAGLAVFLVGLAAVAIPLGILITSIGSIITLLGTLAGALTGTVIAAFAAAIPIIVLLITNWNKFVEVIQSGFDNFIKPVFNTLVDLFNAIKDDFATAFNAVSDLFGSLLDLIGALARALGPVAVAFITLSAIILGAFLKAAAQVITVLAKIVSWLADTVAGIIDLGVSITESALGSLGKFLGLIEETSKETKTLRDTLEETGQSFQDVAEIARAFNQDSRKLIDTEQKIIAIQEEGDKATVNQLNRLADLLEAREALTGSLKENIKQSDLEIKRVEQSIAAAKELGINVKDQQKLLAVLNKNRQDAINTLERQSKLEGDALELSKKRSIEVRKLAEAEKQRITTLKNIQAAEKTLLNTAKELAEIEKGLAQERLNDLDKQLVKIDEVTQAQVDLISSRIEALSTLQETAGPEELEANQKKIDRLLKVSGALENRAKDRQKKILDERAKDQIDFLRKQEIERLKSAEKNVEAAKLEAEQFLEAETEKIEKLFQVSERQTGEERNRAEQRKNTALKLAKEQADGIIAEAERAEIETLEKEEDKTREIAATRQLSLEDKLIGTQLDQIKNLKDLRALFRLIEDERERITRKAIDLANEALAAEQRAAGLRKQLEESTSAEEQERLSRRIEREEQLARIVRGVQETAEARAGFRSEEPGVDAEATKAQEAVTRLQSILDAARLSVAAAVQGIRQTLVEGTTQALDAFLNVWEVKLAELVAMVQASMSQVKSAMDPTQRSSPSLVDLWAMNVATVDEGLKNISEHIMAAAGNLQPQLASFSPSVGNAIGSVSPDVSTPQAGNFGGSLQPAATNVSDSRSLELTVNNNMDMEEMDKRLDRIILDKSQRVGTV